MWSQHLAFILTMNMENTVVQFLNEGWSEEYRIMINVLMDKGRFQIEKKK